MMMINYVINYVYIHVALKSLSFLQRVHFAHIADRCNSHRPSVHPSVTFRCFVQMNEDTIVQSSVFVRQSFLGR